MLSPNDLMQFSPDGLNEASVDALISDVWNVADELANMPAATSALLDGTAQNRRNRRVEARTLGSTVRVLHIQARTSAPFGTEAA